MIIFHLQAHEEVGAVLGLVPPAAEPPARVVYGIGSSSSHGGGVVDELPDLAAGVLVGAAQLLLPRLAAGAGRLPAGP